MEIILLAKLFMFILPTLLLLIAFVRCWESRMNKDSVIKKYLAVLYRLFVSLFSGIIRLIQRALAVLYRLFVSLFPGIIRLIQRALAVLYQLLVRCFEKDWVIELSLMVVIGGIILSYMLFESCQDDYQISISTDGKWSGAVIISGSSDKIRFGENYTPTDSGNVTISGLSASYGGFGNKTIDVGDVSLVSTYIQKENNSSSNLTVKILNHGDVVEEGSNSSAYGTVTLFSHQNRFVDVLNHYLKDNLILPLGRILSINIPLWII